MKNIYYWASDICKSSGEGILARSFIKKLKFYNKNYKIINLCKNSKFQKKNLKQNCSNFFHKYIFPIYGVYILWKYHLNKKNTCYINYLPLWNVLIFLLLPRKTILGPITGSYPLKKWSIKLNFIYKVSSIILNAKYNKLLFATNFFKKYFNKNKRCYYNFIISSIKIFKIKKKRYDFVFYYRKHYNKGNYFLGKIISYLAKKKYKIAIIGDKIYHADNDYIYYYGYVNRNLAINIISKSKYSILSKENLFSYFMQDCLSKQLTIFYNKEYSKFISAINKNIYPKNYNNLIPIDYNSAEAAITIIMARIKNKFITIKNINRANFNFEKYFKI